jgi:hypothetical protein
VSSVRLRVWAGDRGGGGWLCHVRLCLCYVFGLLRE